MSKVKKDYGCKLLPYKKIECVSMLDAAQKASWSISAFDLPEAWKITQGEGVTIAVLDTGADLDHPDLQDNLLEGINFLDNTKSPMDDNGHGCVAPDCLVHTNLSGIEEIESLYDSIDTPARVVQTDDGEYEVKDTSDLDLMTYSLDVVKQQSVVGQITSIQKLPINDEIVTVILEGDTEYHLTPWHPVYLLKNHHHDVYDVVRKRADEVSVGDHFIFGRGPMSGRLVEGDCTITRPAYLTCAHCGHTPKWWRGLLPNQCKKCNRKKWAFETHELIVTTDLAYLAGICLTDGHVSHTSDRFEITSITPNILERVGTIAKNLGWAYAIEDRRILVYGNDAVETVMALGVEEGNKSLIQSLPEWVGRASYDITCAFLAGVIDGDGSISKSNTKNRITTASYDFARKCAALLNSMGISASVSGPYYDTRSRKIKSDKSTFKVVHSSIPSEIVEALCHPVKAARATVTPSRIRKVRRVKAVLRQKFDGHFYDFTVKDYHNYIADGHFVSNTHVTGILVGENNHIGMVGIAPKAKVVPVKVLDKNGNGNLMKVADGIRWAADKGVDFIAMSLGSPNKVQNVCKAIQYAQSKGVVTFVAAGNAGKTDEIFYPANYKETISIGAIDQNFKRADFSCTGRNLDFLAPGVDIFSTFPKHWYATLSGTSMACPFAVGVASLMLSYVKAGKSHIQLKSTEDYRKIFCQYTSHVTDEHLQDPKFYEGFGIIDPRRILAAVQNS